jgi:FkbM family methyltransferase
VTDSPFVSYAQNAEDVVLWRALKDATPGVYVDVGAQHPVVDSVTKAFHERGWRGIHVEPVESYARMLEADRPEDVVIQAVVTDRAVDHAVLHQIDDSGLSTVDDSIAARHRASGFQTQDVVVAATTLDNVLKAYAWSGQEFHFLKVDTEGSEAAVLAGVDLARWRPWIVIVEATLPNSNVPSHSAWEPDLLASGYEFRLFDGVSRFYVAEERAEALGHLLSYPANAVDHFVTEALQTARVERDHFRAEGESWWMEALESREILAQLRETKTQVEAELVGARVELAKAQGVAEAKRSELQRLQASVWWRWTAPLRSGTTALRRAWGRLAR